MTSVTSRLDAAQLLSGGMQQRTIGKAQVMKRLTARFNRSTPEGQRRPFNRSRFALSTRTILVSDVNHENRGGLRYVDTKARREHFVHGKHEENL